MVNIVNMVNSAANTLMKFQKNGRKCLNTSCMYIHALPLEYQFAQSFFNRYMQFASLPDSFEAINSTFLSGFAANFIPKSGTSNQCILGPEVDIQPINILKNDAQSTAQISSHNSQQADAVKSQDLLAEKNNFDIGVSCS